MRYARRYSRKCDDIALNRQRRFLLPIIRLLQRRARSMLDGSHMIRSPRQERILRRLALLGDGPAAFYRDACRIMGEDPRLDTAAHLLAHCLREIESALRRVLLPVDYRPPPQRDACGNRSEGHKAQVQAILKAYSFTNSDVVFVAWLRLSDSDDLGLHRLAHRDSLGSPREVDSTIEELWDLTRRSAPSSFNRLSEK
jgi:hypothetical protein